MYSKLQNVNKGFMDRNTMFTFCRLLYTLYRGTGSVDYGDTLSLDHCPKAVHITIIYLNNKTKVFCADLLNLDLDFYGNYNVL
jgi:hypothetical protein